MSEWNPLREAFFRKTLTEDFKTIYQRQLDIAESGTYVGGSQIRTRMRMGGGIHSSSGTLKAHLAAAHFEIRGVDPIELVTNYPLYIRFLDMKKKGNWQIYNRQIWGVLYNNTIWKLRDVMDDSLRSEVRSQLEDLFPRSSGD